MDVLALIIAVLLIYLLMRGSVPISARKPSSPRTYHRFYLRGIFSSWFLVSIVGIIVLHDGIPLSSLGLLLPTCWWPTLFACVGVSILFSVVLFLHLQPLKDEQFAAELAREKRRLALPRTSSERLLWVGVSLNAGIWEEIVFRGFLPWYLPHHVTLLGFPIPFIWAASFSLLLFSLGHLYQGWRGLLGAGLVGITLALLYAVTGNLLASMLWHFLFDVRHSFGTPTMESLARPAEARKDLPTSVPPRTKPLSALPASLNSASTNVTRAINPPSASHTMPVDLPPTHPYSEATGSLEAPGRKQIIASETTAGCTSSAGTTCIPSQLGTWRPNARDAGPGEPPLSCHLHPAHLCRTHQQSS